MNQERVRERQGMHEEVGTEKRGHGQHSHLKGLQSALGKLRDHFQGEPMVGGFHPEDHIPVDQEIVLFFPEPTKNAS